jgi:hypothetical protein
MESHGFIEIDGEADALQVGRILEAAYGASRRHRIFVWLRRMDWAAVDAILDPVVARIGNRVTGLEFLREDERERAIAMGTSASFCVVTSSETEALLSGRSVDCLGMQEGLSVLQSYARREGPIARPTQRARERGSRPPRKAVAR